MTLRTGCYFIMQVLKRGLTINALNVTISDLGFRILEFTESSHDFSF